MGEYVNNIKLGTCEDLYYARLSQVQALQGAEEYRNPVNGFRYRFPFPEEDDVAVGEYEDYDKGLLIFLDLVNAPKLWNLLLDEDWNHQRLSHSANYRGVCNVNISLPCPLSHDLPLDTKVIELSLNGASKAIVLQQQKQVDGQVWIVVACPYCGAKVRLEPEYAEEVAACLEETAKHHDKNRIDNNGGAYWREVARRILEGYRQGEPT